MKTYARITWSHVVIVASVMVLAYAVAHFIHDLGWSLP